MLNPHGNAFYKGNRLADTTFIVVGCGAIGSNLAIALARQGAKHLELVDNDRVEMANISTTTYTTMDVTRLKVEALADQIYNIDEEILVKTHSFKLERNTMRRVKPSHRARNNPQVVFLDCVDYADGGTARRFMGNLPDYNVLHLGLNDAIGLMHWDVDYESPQISKDEAQAPACDIPYSLNLVNCIIGMGVHIIYQWVNDGAKVSRDFNLHTGQFYPV